MAVTVFSSLQRSIRSFYNQKVLTGPYKAAALHSSPQIPSNNVKHFQFVLIEIEMKKKKIL